MPTVRRGFKHDESPDHLKFYHFKSPVFTAGLTYLCEETYQKGNQSMKIYIICEHCDSWGGTPDEMEDIILGVYEAKEGAEECLWNHVRYGYSQGIPKLSLVNGMASDADGVSYFEIVEKELAQCSKPTY